jgi:hypothetical protein
MRLLLLLTEHPDGLLARDCAALIGADDLPRLACDCAARLRQMELGGFIQRKDATAKRGIIWLITPAGADRLAAGDPRKLPRGPRKDHPHGTWWTYREAGCRCDLCRAWAHQMSQEHRARHPDITQRQSESNRRWRAANPEKHLAAVRRRNRRDQAQNAESAAKARERGHHNHQWTGPELEIAARPDLTPVQVAAMIGRSIRGVTEMRIRIKKEPKLQMLAGLPDYRKEWSVN